MTWARSLREDTNKLDGSHEDELFEYEKSRRAECAGTIRQQGSRHPFKEYSWPIGHWASTRYILHVAGIAEIHPTTTAISNKTDFMITLADDAQKRFNGIPQCADQVAVD